MMLFEYGLFSTLRVDCEASTFGSYVLTFVPAAGSSDLVGTLRISGVSTIEVPSVYLDSWLAALLECVRATKEGADHVEVDLVEEAQPLVAIVSAGELSLRFERQAVILGPLSAVIPQLVSDAQEFLRCHRFQNEILKQEIANHVAALRS